MLNLTRLAVQLCTLWVRDLPEEEPLVVASGVGVHAHIEIIIRIMPPHNHIEVATFEV